MTNRMINALLALSLFTACSYQPQKHETDITLPQQLQSETQPLQLISSPQQQWWQSFASAELDALLQELNSNNLSLHSARQRIERAQALQGQQRASNFPAVTFAANQNLTRNHELHQGSDEHNLQLQLSYEVDLWGSRSAANHAAQLGIISEQLQLQSLSLQLQSQLSESYLSLLALQQKLTIAEQNLKSSEELTKLIETRYRHGSASQIELNQQANLTLQQQTLITTLKAQLINNQRALAVLLGRTELDSIALETDFSATAMPAVSIMQPATLLQSRPDIRLAEVQLQLADATLYQARKQRWPTLQLSGAAVSTDAFAGNTVNTSSLLAALSAPLFDAGNIRNRIEAAEIDSNIALTGYRQTVLTALQEAMNTLTTLDHQRRIHQLSQTSLNNSEELYQLARLRYEAGSIDFLQLLNAQQLWFSAQDAMIDSKLNSQISIINTFRAMGNIPVTDSVPAEKLASRPQATTMPLVDQSTSFLSN